MPLLIFDVVDEKGNIMIREYLSNMPVLRVPRNYEHWDAAIRIAKDRATYVQMRRFFG